MEPRREEKLFSSKENKTTQEIGDFLMSLGEKLKTQSSFTIKQGERVFKVKPQGRTRLELDYTRKGEKYEFEIEIEWRPDKDIKEEVQIT